MRLEELELHQADEARQRHEAELKLHRVLSFFVTHLLICIHTVWHLCFLFCCFLWRMPLWSSLMALLCLRPCLKMIQKHKHCTVHQEWILWFKDIFYHPGFLIHACIVNIVIVQAKPIIPFGSLTLHLHLSTKWGSCVHSYLKGAWLSTNEGRQRWSLSSVAKKRLWQTARRRRRRC